MLASLLPQSLFAFLLVFCRVGSVFMVLPTIGETFIGPQFRLAFALLVAGLLTPVVADTLPPLPADPGRLFILILGEILIGVFVGGLVRLIMTGLQVAGTVVAMQTSLSTGQMFDPAQGTQGTILANLMTMVGLAVIFASDLHLVLIAATGDTYRLFPAGSMPLTGDLAQAATSTAAQSFKMAIQLSAPLTVFSLIFYLGLGAINRLMPQLQVFFIAQPLQIGISLIVLAAALASVYGWFQGYFAEALAALGFR